MSVPIAVTIAGSDSGGGAGIQADLKTFSALGVYGASVITALTAQNTQGVSDILEIDRDFVRAQIDAVFGDLDVGAVKIGMLGSAGIIEAVATGLRVNQAGPVVLDPVMVAKSGDALLAADAVAALRKHLLPIATIITPNLPEAAVLLEADEPADRAGMERAANALLELGAHAVLLKGGHLEAGDSPDFFTDGAQTRWLDASRIDTLNTHGTGCTLSSAIAAYLAHGAALSDAVASAKSYVEKAIAGADRLGVGRGRGPVDHFHAIWPKLET